MMKKVSIVAVAVLALIVIGYLIYTNFFLKSNPCASIFDQTTDSLEEQTNILRKKGDVILGRDQIQKLSDQSDRITADLKTCCILFHDDKIDFNEFLKCQDDFNHYKRDINRLAHLVSEAQGGRQRL